jgi:hypothetical protein
MMAAIYMLPQRTKWLEKTIRAGGYDAPSLAYREKRDGVGSRRRLIDSRRRVG